MVVLAPLKRKYTSGDQEDSQKDIPQEAVEFKTDHEVN